MLHGTYDQPEYTKNGPRKYQELIDENDNNIDNVELNEEKSSNQAQTVI